MRFFLLLFPLVSLLTTSCQKQSKVALANAKDALIIGNGAEPETLDPQLATGVTESRIIDALFEGLVGTDPKTLQAIPTALATHWEISQDGTSYTFFLRKNAVWNDAQNSPVTAHDFVYAYHRILHPHLAAKNAYMLYPLAHAEDYNTNNRGRILFDYASESPLDWHSIHKLPWKANPSVSLKNALENKPFLKLSPQERQLFYQAKGLNGLSKEALTFLLKKPQDFPWGHPIETKVQQTILQRLLDFYGSDLWEQAHVGVEAKDDYTLLLKLRSPTPYLLEVLQHMSWYPVHAKTIEKYGSMTALSNPWTRLGKLVGNGAFVLKEWRLNDHITLSKSPHYWDKNHILLQSISFLPIDNAETEQRAFRTNALHMTASIPPHRILWAKKHLKESLRIQTYLGVYFYRIHITPPSASDHSPKAQARRMLCNKKVRQALSLALDREEICSFLKAGQQPAYSFVPPGTGGYRADKQLPSATLTKKEAISQARQLLKEAGYTPQQAPEIEILYNTSESHRQIAELIQSQWAKNLGIKVTLYNQEWKVYQATLQSGNYTIARAAWIGDYNDPNTFLDLWLSGGGNNLTGFSHPQYDSLLSEASKESNPTKRTALFKQLESILLDELPMIPIYFYVSQKMVHPSVQGLHPNLLDRIIYKNIRLKK